VPRSAGTPPRETFSRLAVAAAPPSWKSATIPSGGASLSYPSNWRPIPGDTGTVTVALRDRRGLYHGYLNVTPREGAEQLTGWASFRAHRNAEEGDHHTRIVAAAQGLRIARARGSCVIDDYLSRVGAHAYRGAGVHRRWEPLHQRVCGRHAARRLAAARARDRARSGSPHRALNASVVRLPS
jgi:hypothetical protein